MCVSARVNECQSKFKVEGKNVCHRGGDCVLGCVHERQHMSEYGSDCKCESNCNHKYKCE